MTRTVVAGGAGFVGSHLCEALLARGEAVLCLDDLSTGRLDNLAHLRAHPRFALVRGDVADAQLWQALPAARRVYQLASPASPPDYQRMPVQTLRANVVGTLNALDFAQAHGARVLLASTSEVYGDPLEHPQRETYWGNVNPVGPRSVYDEAKRFAEALTMAYRRTHGVDTRIARIFNTYGPHLEPGDGRVVSNFLVQAMRGEVLTVYGDGTQTRSFCYVDDEVEGVLALLDSEWADPMNLGNPEECTVLELAQRVLEVTGSASELVHVGLPIDDPVRRRPDIALAVRELGWHPKVGLDDGLTRTMAWYRSRI